MSKSPLETENPSSEQENLDDSLEINTALKPWWGLFIIFALGFPLFFMFRAPVPNTFDQIPTSLSLMDQHSRPIQKYFFQQQPSIVNFIFTRCQDICPGLSQKMQFIQNQVPSAQLVSISVDPVHDTPTVLSDYSRRFEAGSSWYFLTGSREQITATNQAFQQAYQETRSEDDAPNILHSQKFILVDKKGFIRGFYDDNNKEIKRLLIDYHRIKGFF